MRIKIDERERFLLARRRTGHRLNETFHPRYWQVATGRLPVPTVYKGSAKFDPELAWSEIAWLLRLRAALTVRDVGLLTGVSAQTTSHWERGVKGDPFPQITELQSYLAPGEYAQLVLDYEHLKDRRKRP